MNRTTSRIETFRVPALDCPEELALIAKGLDRVRGVGELYPDYLNRSVKVAFDPQQIDPARIAQRIRQIGFEAQVAAASTTLDDSHAPLAQKVAIAAGGTLLVLAGALWALGYERPTTVAVIASTITSGWWVARAGLRAVRLRALDINALMTIAACGAMATGEYFEAATAMFLFGVALSLESVTLRRARRAIRALVELTPSVAHRFAGDEIEDLDPALVEIGDRLLVKPGERIPVDGAVAAGRSYVNQAQITGESRPVERSAGQPLFAGTLNGDGALEMTVTRRAGDSTLAEIARLVERAQLARAPTERFVDQFARRYTPAVIALAVALATVPATLGALGVGWAASATYGEWFPRALVLLVIACPCALVISTPVTIVCGLYQAARRGILIKGGEALEAAARIDCLVFDKTGTLTSGDIEVIDVQPVDGVTAERLLSIAASVEQRSEHPLAAAIVAAARRDGAELRPIDDFQAHRGLGVRSVLAGQTYYVGNPKFFGENRLPLRACALSNGEASAATVVFVGTRERFLGSLVLADRARADAVSAIAELKQLGIRHTVMTTGDNRAAAERVATEIGIHEVHADLLPQDKLRRVDELQERFACVAVVGDGVNDAPALAAARLGIALGAEASPTALDTADVVILSPQLRRLGELVKLSQRCRRLLAQNIALALSIKGLVLVLAAAGLATMWMAVAADVGTSLLVITNGLRLIDRSSKANHEPRVADR